MFIATNSPQPPGTRLRIEVLEGDRGFMVEGVVAHARKVRGDLMRLSQPGMGVRFLSVEELVRELIPVGLRARPRRSPEPVAQAGAVAPPPPLSDAAVAEPRAAAPAPLRRSARRRPALAADPDAARGRRRVQRCSSSARASSWRSSGATS